MCYCHTHLFLEFLLMYAMEITIHIGFNEHPNGNHVCANIVVHGLRAQLNQHHLPQILDMPLI